MAVGQDWVVEPDREQIKSRERVRELAEVYTHQREVDAMLDLIPEMFRQIDSRFLEPACGDGNFLVNILRRKLALVSEKTHGGTRNWLEFAALQALASIYAVDISDENVSEARDRMGAVIEKEFAERGHDPTPEFLEAVRVILSANIVQGDTLNSAGSIEFIEWEAGEGETFICTPSTLEEPEHDLFYVAPATMPAVHYSKLSSKASR
jgi:hypothetical protein